MKIKVVSVVLFVIILMFVSFLIAYSVNPDFEQWTDIHILNFSPFSGAYKWKYVPDFEKYHNEFELLVDYVKCINCRDGEILSLDYNIDAKQYRIFRRSTQEYEPVSSDMQTVFNTLKHNAFCHKDAYWDTIRVYDNCIVIPIANGEYALVYSPEKKPSKEYLPCRENEKKVEIKKINKSWYHLMKVSSH